jgi:hypothetical protein
VVKGRLDTYTIAKKAIIDVRGKDVHLVLTKRTRFVGDLHVNRGDKVRATIRMHNGTRVVTKLNDEGNNGGDEEDFHGTYETSTTTSLTILGNQEDSCSTPLTFTVDSSTKYFDQNGNPVASLTYTAGEALDVQAVQQTDGSWLATSVSEANDEGDQGDQNSRLIATSFLPQHVGSSTGPLDGGNDNTDDFQGAYQSSTSTSVTIMDEDGNSDTFTVDSNTKYFDQNGNAVSSLTYTVGEQLDIVATQQSDNSWLAQSISVGENEGDQGNCDNQGQGDQGD